MKLADLLSELEAGMPIRIATWKTTKYILKLPRVWNLYAIDNKGFIFKTQLDGPQLFSDNWELCEP